MEKLRPHRHVGHLCAALLCGVDGKQIFEAVWCAVYDIMGRLRGNEMHRGNCGLVR